MTTHPLPRAVLLVVLTAACGSPYLKAGRAYLARGNVPIAIEMLDAGLVQAPNDAELRDALTVAQQTYNHELRQDVDRLAGSGRHLLALRRLVEMEDLARRSAALTLPGEDPRQLEEQRNQLVRKAAESLDHALDVRAGRGAAVKSDLATCRQLLALKLDGESIQRTCDRLRSTFKYIAVLKARPGSAPEAEQTLPAVRRMVIDRNPELLEIVDEAAGTHNAELEIYVGEPWASETGWVMTNRDAYHTWIPKRDKKGRHIEETVTVEPTKKEVEEAKEKKKPPPKPKKKKKKVYELVKGEYRVYKASRSLRIPYAVVIEDLKRQAMSVWFGDTVAEISQSSYYEYRGHPKAKKSAPVPHEGRRNAPRLIDERALHERAVARIPRRVVDTTLGRVE